MVLMPVIVTLFSLSAAIEDDWWSQPRMQPEIGKACQRPARYFRDDFVSEVDACGRLWCPAKFAALATAASGAEAIGGFGWAGGWLRSTELHAVAGGSLEGAAPRDGWLL